ncbi:hypothetical protein PVAP13_9KG590600 [Panicum virgatum]|uniref:Uncharacterized protein n=1 Tax=Panicum virgatum TaxID=38727 RepID=A0A8T0NZ68_PANVG|nr:hypothetical protein PVAP13_9KG590600 [Panicum virgatum]
MENPLGQLLSPPLIKTIAADELVIEACFHSPIAIAGPAVQETDTCA